MQHSKVCLLLLLSILLSGCGSTLKKSYSNPSAPISGVRRIAILPFSGVQEADAVGEIVGMVLSARSSFTVVDRTQIESIINEHRMPSGLIDQETIIQKGKLINADALLSGRVAQFEQGVPSLRPYRDPNQNLLLA